jgi:two-component system sensor histidine kinase CssS
MNDTYPQTLRTSLIDTAVYGTILAFFIFIVIMIIWVFSVIHPLNQIRNYIEQIKQGKEVELYINREDEIGEVANALVSMKEELDRQQKSKEEMMHNISHDLKTPIATIKSYSESIKDGIYPYGTLESSVDVILDNAQRLEDKVHNLLYLNRVEYLIASDASGVVTNMKEVVESVVLNAAVIRPEIKIITDVEEVFFDGLTEAWRVTIENLMENAFRYAKSYIKIEVHENDLRISNDGPKMDESRIESLFRPYEKGEGGRFGLGLSIVQKVTKANNYNVEGFNTEEGVCFRIYRDVPKPNRLNIDLRRRNSHEDKQD